VCRRRIMESPGVCSGSGRFAKPKGERGHMKWQIDWTLMAYLGVACVKGTHAAPHQLSRKLLSTFDWLGCFSFRSALASI
jgi:hypothetical protein